MIPSDEDRGLRVRSSRGTRGQDVVRVELGFGRGGLEKERSLFINM